jgi:hypothetical protein
MADFARPGNAPHFCHHIKRCKNPAVCQCIKFRLSLAKFFTRIYHRTVQSFLSKFLFQLGNDLFLDFAERSIKRASGGAGMSSPASLAQILDESIRWLLAHGKAVSGRGPFWYSVTRLQPFDLPGDRGDPFHFLLGHRRFLNRLNPI